MALLMEDTGTAVRAGDVQAFETFVRANDRKLRGVAWAVVRNAEQTDDIMQSAYEKAFRALPDFDGRSSMTTWLHSIIYRTAIDFVRYEGRRRHSDLDAMRNVGGTSDAASQGIDRVELGDVMDQLSPEERATLMVVTGLGYSYDDAAEILGESRGTIASRISRTRNRISRWEEQS